MTIIQTILMCGEMRIPTHLLKAIFQHRFSVNVFFTVQDDQVIGTFILEGRLRGEAYLRFLQ